MRTPSGTAHRHPSALAGGAGVDVRVDGAAAEVREDRLPGQVTV
jgi:hypothetical protein